LSEVGDNALIFDLAYNHKYVYLFNNIINRFQLKLKDRRVAGNILAEELKGVMKKEKDEKKLMC
jgi:hypothetical protein